MKFFRLMCVDGELAVNGVAAALCFPELLSCPSYHACQASLTLLLPDHTLHEIQHRLNTLITLKPAYIQARVNSFKSSLSRYPYVISKKFLKLYKNT
jgi:hypothetical protein